MKFNDFTLLAGTIKSRRQQDTAKLEATAIAKCAAMLRELRKGEDWVYHNMLNLPAFGVSLGPPAFLLESMGEQVEAPNRFFCVSSAADIDTPFQFNLVLDRHSLLTEADDRAVSTALALSGSATELAAHMKNDEGIEAQVREITAARPVVATALLPQGLISVLPDFRELIMIASDFSTCFAAAMLLEEEENTN